MCSQSDEQVMMMVVNIVWWAGPFGLLRCRVCYTLEVVTLVVFSAVLWLLLGTWCGRIGVLQLFLVACMMLALVF